MSKMGYVATTSSLIPAATVGYKFCFVALLSFDTYNDWQCIEKYMPKKDLELNLRMAEWSESKDNSLSRASLDDLAISIES